ncbi:alpha/beta hydrolase [Nocardioides immobilis]|uniref:Alpha/beta hydrolase n=1 Tax=Nocardioides immobilis TaxID=2049295 RepID=A0A417Y6Z6_9ACTN|nr:alpha/beta hydrolase [Nocardioides immobilis]RHW28498.1 alpha/beta hydrolase [Nocardioides immobilis]
MGTTHETTTLATEDGVKIHVYTWAVNRPRGVVQVTHGMGEHALRYTELAATLNSEGWTVVAQDHRGHGASAATPDALGQIGADGWAALVGDISAVRRYAADAAPGKPVVLFGHSMGSFAVQQFLPDCSDDIDGVVLTGTAALDLLEPALDLEADLDLAMFNAPFAPARTAFDWLSRDEERVDQYVTDPLTGFGLDVPGTKGLFAGARRLADPDALSGLRHDLPVLVAVGDADPVNAGLALAHPLIERYIAAGLTDVDLKVYNGARHELTNEINRDEFMSDLLAWLDTRFPA